MHNEHLTAIKKKNILIYILFYIRCIFSECINLTFIKYFRGLITNLSQGIVRKLSMGSFLIFIPNFTMKLKKM